MSKPTSIFLEIFALWPSKASLARDLGVRSSCAHQWIRRGYVDPWYWPRLTDIAEQRFGRVFTYRQLVEASAALRGPPAAKRYSRLPQKVAA